MSDLRELYQEVILDHHKKPRNFRKLEGARHVEGYNPLCGDRITVYLKVRDGVIQDISFQGIGCAISTASASMMTDSLKGKTLTEAEALFKSFHELLTGQQHGSEDAADLGKLEVFSGVREFPVRVKCATLAWHTFHAALEGKDEPVSTE
ncbi:MAG TPA: SUF system NifU family Fe-S cluster assembly protein [Gemmataceae bacterium]|jgi:nitrogen fixation NifU-like protein|nr:SUF system NifU family Fe-S cluster assembly protein [Gemmataceae bacterium]